MFTPQEVSEKTFPKASGFNNGYGMAAVDEFLAETNVEGGYIKVRLIEGMRTDV